MRAVPAQAGKAARLVSDDGVYELRLVWVKYGLGVGLEKNWGGLGGLHDFWLTLVMSLGAIENTSWAEEFIEVPCCSNSRRVIHPYRIGCSYFKNRLGILRISRPYSAFSTGKP